MAAARVRSGRLGWREVTAIAGEDGQALLQTVFGVKSGDTILLGEVDPESQLGHVHRGLHADPRIAARLRACSVRAARLRSEGSDATMAAVTLTISPDCKLDPMEFVIVGTNHVDDRLEPRLSIDKTGVSFVANGSTTITGSLQAPQLAFAASYSDAGSAANVQLERFAPDNFGFDTSGNGSLANGLTPVTLTGPAASSAVDRVRDLRAPTSATNGPAAHPRQRDDLRPRHRNDDLPWLGQPTFDIASETIHAPVTIPGY